MPSPEITIRLINWKGETREIPIESIADVMEYSNPEKSGALLKACLVYANIVEEKTEIATCLEAHLTDVTKIIQLFYFIKTVSII